MSLLSTPRFELAEPIEAERQGRAAIEANPELRGKKVAAVVDASFAGACALAALRHAANLGAECEVFLTSPQADGNSAFVSMLETVGCMDLPVGVRPKNFSDLPPADLILLGADLSATDREALGKNKIVEPARFDSVEAWRARPAGSKPETFLHELVGDVQLYSADEIRSIDEIAAEEYGMSGLCLMENAGLAACAVAREMLGLPDNKRVLILSGRGNNGGDAFVVARGLIEGGVPVDVCLLAEPSALRGDAAENFRILAEAGVESAVLKNSEELRERLAGCALVVDGMLGTGVKGKVRAPFDWAINELNASGKPVLALDIPSGLDADTGEPLGLAVNAARTVTFAAVKLGFEFETARKHCGEIVLADIGAPMCIFDEL